MKKYKIYQILFIIGIYNDSRMNHKVQMEVMKELHRKRLNVDYGTG